MNKQHIELVGNSEKLVGNSAELPTNSKTGIRSL